MNYVSYLSGGTDKTQLGQIRNRENTGPVYICHFLTTAPSCWCGFYTSIKSMETTSFYAVGVLLLFLGVKCSLQESTKCLSPYTDKQALQ